MTHLSHSGADRVLSNCIPVPETGCFLFEGVWDVNGYGKLRNDSKDCLAHRLVLGVTNPGMKVCHKCDTPACCNPLHLFIATQADNLRDMRNKGRGRGLSGKGEIHSMAKLTDKKVRQIFHAPGTNRAVAKQFGISQSNVSAIKRGAIWKHLNLRGG